MLAHVHEHQQSCSGPCGFIEGNDEGKRCRPASCCSGALVGKQGPIKCSGVHARYVSSCLACCAAAREPHYVRGSRPVLRPRDHQLADRTQPQRRRRQQRHVFRSGLCNGAEQRQQPAYRRVSVGRPCPRPGGEMSSTGWLIRNVTWSPKFSSQPRLVGGDQWQTRKADHMTPSAE